MLLKKAVTKFKTAITDGESSTGNDSVAGGGGNRNYSALSNKSGLRERVLNGGGGVNVAIDNPGYNAFFILIRGQLVTRLSYYIFHPRRNLCSTFCRSSYKNSNNNSESTRAGAPQMPPSLKAASAIADSPLSPTRAGMSSGDVAVKVAILSNLI